MAAESHTAAINRIEEIARLEQIDCDFYRVDGYLFLAPGDKEEILEREVVKNNNARMMAHYIVDTRVVAVVVAQVIDNSVVVVETIERRRGVAIVEKAEVRCNLRVIAAKAVNEQVDVSVRGQLWQKFLAVVGDSGRLWAERAKVRDPHSARSTILFVGCCLVLRVAAGGRVRCTDIQRTDYAVTCRVHSLSVPAPRDHVADE